MCDAAERAAEALIKDSPVNNEIKKFSDPILLSRLVPQVSRLGLSRARLFSDPRPRQFSPPRARTRPFSDLNRLSSLPRIQ